MMKKSRARRSGFTLVELLEVILIMGILFALVLTAVKHSLAHAKEEKTKAAVRTIAAALRAYRYEYQRWPTVVMPADEDDQEVELTDHPQFLKYMEDNNPREVGFLNKAEYAFDGQGYFIDTWLTRLRIVVDFGADTVEVTSAGPNTLINDPPDDHDNISAKF